MVKLVDESTILPMTKTDPTAGHGAGLEALSRQCTEQMLEVVKMDTARLLGLMRKTIELTGQDEVAKRVGVSLGYKLTAEDVERLDGMADVVLKLEQARANARKSDEEIERLVTERMRRAVEEAGLDEPG
jgi:hypothetical protein